MPTWAPGKPVQTAQDHAEWQVWRRARKLQQQRDRRAKLRRIDYHASPDAAAALDMLRQSRSGSDYSRIIDSIVTDWLAHCHRNKKGAKTAPG